MKKPQGCISDSYKSSILSILQHKDDAGWDQLGGIEGVASALRTSLADGIDPNTAAVDIAVRRAAFGSNALREIPSKNFFVLWFGTLKDPILIMLMAAALASTILGVAVTSEREQNAWTEGVAIWVAVLVVSLVGAGNDWHKDRQFQRINAQKDVIEVKVIRAGKHVIVKNTELVVGDVMLLDTGDKVVADAYVIDSHGLSLDEASLTGEADPIKKGDPSAGLDPWVRSGTQVIEGSGKSLIIAVGEHSEWGRTMSLVVGEPGDTPLQEKLGVLATAIGKVGFVVAVICFVVLMIRWMVENHGFPISQFASGPLAFFIFAVTIIVVAVPEGLPLAVTISLAYSMGQMMKDNNFVRVLAACETMGGATAICSDKTGTLTENRMTVVEGWFAGTKFDSLPDPQSLTPEVREEISNNSALNSKAFLTGGEGGVPLGFVGNRTECALLLMLREWCVDYKTIRTLRDQDIVKVYGFTSERKMASVLVRQPNGTLRLYTKGAADWVLRRCTAAMGPEGCSTRMDPSKAEELMEIITAMASRGLRTLCLTYIGNSELLFGSPVLDEIFAPGIFFVQPNRPR